MSNYGKHGLYCVDDIQFINKAEALAFASLNKKQVIWKFNDEVFSSFDWTVPIEISLPELYKQRAQQIRDQYDYVSLLFGGGVDAANILHAFIDNDIALDEIVMFKPFSQSKTANDIDKSPKNLYSEIEFAAIPHLKKYLKNNNTLVRLIDMEECISKFLSYDRLLLQFHKFSCLSPESVAHAAACYVDEHWRNLFESGKNVVHVQGIDKPSIQFKDSKYVFHFDEVATVANQFEPFSITDAESDMLKKHLHHEYFYWTPDLPQLVIKQCQVVKQLCLDNVLFKLLLSGPQATMDNRIIPIIHHIYPAHVNSIRDLFHTGKQTSGGIIAEHHQWIYECTSSEVVGKFKDVIINLQNSIDDRFFQSPNNYYMNSSNKLNFLFNQSEINKNQFLFFKSKPYFL